MLFGSGFVDNDTSLKPSLDRESGVVYPEVVVGRLLCGNRPLYGTIMESFS